MTQRLKADQVRLEALFKTKFVWQESKYDALAVDIRRIPKRFLSSNGRNDSRTNDSWYLRNPRWTKID